MAVSDQTLASQRNVALCHKPPCAGCSKPQWLFDHLVGAREQPSWSAKSEHLRGLEEMAATRPPRR
jgi:hypothetical protein